jgi:hypothetical protein
MNVFAEFAEVSNPQIAERLGSQIANPQRVTFQEGPQIPKTIQVRLFADICGTYLRPHTLAFFTHIYT